MAEKNKKTDNKLRRINGIVFALAALIIIVSIGSGKFLSWSNITNVLRQIVPLGIMACAGTYVVITGNIDLSVGSTLSFCALLSCNLVSVSTALAIVAPLALGAACGLFNGFLVGRLRFNPFIATLGTMSVIQALAFFYCDGKFLSAGTNDAYKQIGQGFLLGLPVPVYLLLAVFAVLTIVLSKTTFGRAVYIVGGNPICAKYSGISYGRTISLAYMLSGIAAAVSAIVLVARQMAAQPEMGAGYEFDVVTAVVLGGRRALGRQRRYLGRAAGRAVHRHHEKRLHPARHHAVLPIHCDGRDTDPCDLFGCAFGEEGFPCALSLKFCCGITTACCCASSCCCAR